MDFGFSIHQATAADIEWLVYVKAAAMADDLIWKNLMRGVSWEDQYGVWRRGDKRRFGENDNQTFKVVEDSTGYIQGLVMEGSVKADWAL